MEFEDLLFWGMAALVPVTLALPVFYKVLRDLQEIRQSRARVLAAEEKAFGAIPKELASQAAEVWQSQEALERRTKDLAAIVEHSQSLIRMGVLFDLYNKQIENYKNETRSRAGWSFIFAIIAMFAGVCFVIWGGALVFRGGGWQNVAAGAAISGIGGAVSAYITKTFLDVHKVSLLQLNSYFRQPVLNGHILTAQRLADMLDESARRDAYCSIIARVVALIGHEQAAVPAPHTTDERSILDRLSPASPQKLTGDRPHPVRD